MTSADVRRSSARCPSLAHPYADGRGARVRECATVRVRACRRAPGGVAGGGLTQQTPLRRRTDTDHSRCKQINEPETTQVRVSVCPSVRLSARLSFVPGCLSFVSQMSVVRLSSVCRSSFVRLSFVFRPSVVHPRLSVVRLRLSVVRLPTVFGRLSVSGKFLAVWCQSWALVTCLLPVSGFIPTCHLGFHAKFRIKGKVASYDVDFCKVACRDHVFSEPD